MNDNREHFLSKFLEPESVAVVGASSNPSRINYHLVANLVNLGFRGRIYPVHPKEKEILGLKTYPSVKHIDETVDLAVIGVSQALTLEILRDCVEKGIKRVTMIAGGFSETGGEGKNAQDRMVGIIRDNGMRAIGPNALSPINVPAGFCVSFHPVHSFKPGGLSLIFQSGLYEPRFNWLLSDFNYHLNKLIDLGNKMDINEVDALSYLVQDPGTRVIGIHLESIGGDGREFLRLIGEASALKKRVVVLKSGRSEAGAKAAASHTGALVQGSDRLFDGAIRQFGAIRAHNLEEFFDLTRALERFGDLSLKGNRIFVATFPGGEGVIATDLCEHEGLRLAEVGETTLRRLRPVFPPWDIPPNPWDLGLTVQFNDPGVVYLTLIDSLIQDPNVDALAIQLHPMAFLLPKEAFQMFERAIDAHKPVVLWIAGMESGRHPTLEWLEEKQIPVFPCPEKAIRALAALHRLSGPSKDPSPSSSRSFGSVGG
ncbi:MAG: CoA-binding protein [Deltaproteobacteria bacterium]|nr:CoA-binding protein [Deltaproteobacteria bacterium]